MIEKIEALAVDAGALATKVSGAGGGGFMMFMCDPADRLRLVTALRGAGGSIYDTRFTYDGATSWRIG
jgi:D-glycero-alpha-D-manno-heptose-7-phosphate kinase